MLLWCVERNGSPGSEGRGAEGAGRARGFRRRLLRWFDGLDVRPDGVRREAAEGPGRVVVVLGQRVPEAIDHIGAHDVRRSSVRCVLGGAAHADHVADVAVITGVSSARVPAHGRARFCVDGRVPVVR